MNAALLSLPLTSVIIDVIFVGLICLLLKDIIGIKKSIILSIIWTFSWFSITNSSVSWNVALVPLWSLLTFYSSVCLIEKKSIKHFYMLGLLAGLSVHIHVATIPVIPLLSLFFFRYLKFNLSEWVKMLICAIIPVLPLISYDLTHNLRNAHLLRDQITVQSQFKAPFFDMLQIATTKLGKVVSGLFLSKFKDNLILGIIILILSIKSMFFDNRVYLRFAGLSVLIAFSLIIALHDYGFPEYYFAPAYLSMCLIVIAYFEDFLSLAKRFKNSILVLTIILLMIANIRSYAFEPSGFSLKVKNEIIDTLSIYQVPINIDYDFDPGRDGGLRYLVQLKKIPLDNTSKIRILLTDKLNTPLYIGGELATDAERVGNIKSAIYIVQ